MNIKLVPQRSDAPLLVSKIGDILTINGVAYDFSPLPEGATLPADAVDCTSVVGPVERINGELQITLLLPHGPNPTQEQAFPEDILNPPDGDILLPQNVGASE